MSYVRTNNRGFTLVEVLVVVLVLSIIALMVVPEFSNASQRSTATSLQGNVNAIKQQVIYQRHETSDGSYPVAILPAWFTSGKLPEHPQNTFGVASIQVYTTDTIRHPSLKVMKAGVAGAYWYNKNTGDVRARVADMGSAAATLDFYNLVNQSNETSLGNYGGGGGGGGS